MPWRGALVRLPQSPVVVVDVEELVVHVVLDHQGERAPRCQL